MKINIKNFAIFTLAIMLLSSCGSISISQKRYSNGLNIDWFAGKDKKSEPAKVTKRTKKAEPSKTVVNQNDEKHEAVATDWFAENNTEAEVLINNEAPVQSFNKANNHNVVKANVSSNVDSEKPKTNKISTLKAIKKIKQAQRDKTNDGFNILYLILALFPILCLIAVFLYDGGVTTNFWVDLILHLTVIGAMIFAVLVVLGIVSL